MASWYATRFVTIIGFKQVAVDVERDEDESGTFGETFIDYVRVYASFIFMKKRDSSFVLPRSLPVFTSIVAFEKFTYSYSISRDLPSYLLVFLILTL